MKKFGDGQQPFHAVVDIPEGDSQELTTVTDQALNSLYGELYNLLQTHGINPTATTNADLKQVARAVWAAVNAGTLFVDTGTANVKLLTHVKGANFLFRTGNSGDNGFIIEFLNKVENTGAITVNVFDVENNQNHFNNVPLVDANLQDYAAKALPANSMVKAYYDYATNKFIVINVYNVSMTDSLVLSAENLPLRNVSIQTVNSIAELETLNKFNGRIVHVKSYHAGRGKGGGNFIYDSTKLTQNDKGMVMNGWVRQCDPSYLNPYNFGAYGDGSENDYDNAAFDAMSKYIKSSTLKGFSIHIHHGVYCVINQQFTAGSNVVTTSALNVKFDAMQDKAIIVKSDGAVLKVRSNLRFGVFNILSGQPAVGGVDYEYPFVAGSASWAANQGKLQLVNVGYVLNFENINTLVMLGNIEIDGNASGAVIGGKMLANGTDTVSYGLRVANVEKIYIDNVETHDHLTDGIYIAGYNYGYGNTYDDIPLNAEQVKGQLNGKISNITAYRCGRQCLTIAGGQNLNFYNLNLWDGGVNGLPVISMPRTVVDIEAELSPVRNLNFYDCTFKGGGYAVFAMAALNIKGINFYDCKFISSSAEMAVGVSKAKVRFFNCYVNGYVSWTDFHTLGQSDRTLFENCTFTDDPTVNPTLLRTQDTNYIFNMVHGGNPILNNCTFDLYTGMGIYTDGGAAGGHPSYNARTEFNDVVVNIYTQADLASKLQFNGVGLVRIRDFRKDKTLFYWVSGDKAAFDGVFFFESLDGTKTNLKVWDGKDSRYSTKIINKYTIGSTVEDPLKGKVWAKLGDSITYNVNSYANVLAAKHGAILVSYAQDGARVHRTADSDTYLVLAESYQSITETPDIITVAAGVNDPIDGQNLGTFADRTKYTFYGALHVLLSGLRAKFPNARIGFLSPIPNGYMHYADGDMNNSHYVKTKAIREVCAYYSIPVWVGALEFGANPLDNAAWQDKYMPDGLHPSADGHIWYANRVENFILNLAK